MPDFMSECALHLDQLIKIKIIPFQYCMLQRKGEKVYFQIFWWIEIICEDPKYN